MKKETVIRLFLIGSRMMTLIKGVKEKQLNEKSRGLDNMKHYSTSSNLQYGILLYILLCCVYYNAE